MVGRPIEDSETLAASARKAAVDALAGAAGVELVVITKCVDTDLVACASNVKTLAKAHTLLGVAAEMIRKQARETG